MVADAALLGTDSEARKAALDVAHSYIVQAPAGSGKTELLIQRYLRLLGNVTEPEEVVAITFTRKAALEMQLRVINALRRAFDGATAEAGHERVTLAAATEVLERDLERGWNLLQSPRRMRIQTLDAFCATVARLAPISSGLGGLLTTAADAGMTRLYQDAAALTLDWLVTDDGYASIVEQVLDHLDNNTRDYVAYLARMLATRDQWLTMIGSGDVTDPEDVRRRLEATTARQIEAQLSRTRDALAAAGDAGVMRLVRYAGEELQRTSGEHHPLASVAVDEWPPTTSDAVAEWRALAELLLTKQGNVRKRVNRSDGFPPDDNGEKEPFEALLADLDAMPGVADALRRVRLLPDAHYRDEQWQVLVALFRLLPLAVGELKRLFVERGTTDHIEVAQAAHTALGSVEVPGDAAMLMDYRISHLLVDEMQDTSVGQYRLLEKLTCGWQAGDGRTLFCVGDPMQSIYRFRDAEVGQFLAARQSGIGEVPLRSLVLRRNFRSGEYLVHWFNTVFPRLMPVADDIAAGAIRYSESVPVEAHRGQGEVAVHALFDRSALDEARHTAAVIRKCLAADLQGDVAVLVRSRTQLPPLLAELRDASVPYRAVDIDRLTDLPEIIDLLALTRALCHLDDRVAWLGLLRAPWVGLTWRDLHALVRNDRTSALFELLQDRERLERLSADGRARVGAFLTGLVPHLRARAEAGLRERVECAWLALGGAAAIADDNQLANVYRYLDVLEGIESAGTLPDVVLLERQLDEERVSGIHSADCRLHIMTMHKAKGLQFDHVVLPGLGRTSGRSDKAVLNWMNVTLDDGGSGMIVSPLGARAVLEKDPLHRYIEEAAKDADRLELDRLLYVACTRARRSLHLIGAVRSNSEGDELRPPPAGSLLHRLWPALAGEFEQQFAQCRGDSDAADGGDEMTMCLPWLRRFTTAWSETIPPPLPAVSATCASDGSERRVDYYWVGAMARHAGTIVHRWLQLLTERGRHVAAPPDYAEALTRRWARALGVPWHEIDGVWRRVDDALGKILSDAKGRWLLFGDGHAELRLTGVRNGRPESIVIDRVRIDDGRHWIIDYKTSSHEGGDLQGFLAREADRYREQLARYRAIYRGVCDAPLRTALYFPLLQQFVEVEN